jgi:hypothetical protein
MCQAQDSELFVHVFVPDIRIASAAAAGKWDILLVTWRNYLIGLFEVHDQRPDICAVILYLLVYFKLAATSEWQVMRFVGQFVLKVLQGIANHHV